MFTGQRLLHLHNLTGSQVGAYFGHSVAVLDANGDGLDDIAIGAPLHTELMDNYEAGRVYVVYQNEDVSLTSALCSRNFENVKLKLDLVEI